MVVSAQPSGQARLCHNIMAVCTEMQDAMSYSAYVKRTVPGLRRAEQVWHATARTSHDVRRVFVCFQDDGDVIAKPFTASCIWITYDYHT